MNHLQTQQNPQGFFRAGLHSVLGIQNAGDYLGSHYDADRIQVPRVQNQFDGETGSIPASFSLWDIDRPLYAK